MKKRKEHWKYFRTQYPEVHKAYSVLGKSIGDAGPLDKKTCALIKLGVAAASQYDFALRSIIERAQNAGCSVEEMEHAILQSTTTAGFPRMMAALLILREEQCTI